MKEHLILFEKVDLKESHLDTILKTNTWVLCDVLLKNNQTLMPK